MKKKTYWVVGIQVYKFVGEVKQLCTDKNKNIKLIFRATKLNTLYE